MIVYQNFSSGIRNVFTTNTGPLAKNIGFAFGLFSIFLLGACIQLDATRPQKPDYTTREPALELPDPPTFKSTPRGSSEELLAAEGNWNMVEEGDIYDPAMAHLNARSKVDPKKMKIRSDLTPHFDPNAGSNDGKFRVLRLEPNRPGWKDDLEEAGGYQVAESTIVKPTQRVASADLVQSIKTVFAQQGAATESYKTADAGQYNEEENKKPKSSKQDANAFDFPDEEQGAPDGSVIAEEAHLRAGIVVPPPLPARKIPAQPIVADVTPIVSKKMPVNPPEKKKGFFDSLLKTEKGPVKQNEAAQVTTNKQEPSKYQIISSGEAGKGTAHMTGLRSGMHPGKTRITMDMSSSVKYKVAIDHIRNVLRIKLEKTSWDVEEKGAMKNSTLLGSYVTQKQSDGSVVLEVRLKRPARIIDTTILRPDKSFKHRIYVDLEG